MKLDEYNVLNVIMRMPECIRKLFCHHSYYFRGCCKSQHKDSEPTTHFDTDEFDNIQHSFDKNRTLSRKSNSPSIVKTSIKDITHLTSTATTQQLSCHLNLNIKAYDI